MYHLDGHREHNVRLTPEETRRNKGICPVCKKPLTFGVLYRVEELADRPAGFVPPGAVPFKKAVELDKIIAEALGVKSRTSIKVKKEYDRLIEAGGNELKILLHASIEDLENMTLPEVAEGIRRVREGKVFIEPGFDGQYGTVKIFSDEEKKENKQGRLF
jgi:PHP family Zn ribbon phosphoesterase